MQPEKRNLRKVRIGVVVSDKIDKTITVRVLRTSRHPMYLRTVKRYAKFKAHDEKNEAKAGNLVKIAETRPLSKDKRWRLVEILEK